MPRRPIFPIHVLFAVVSVPVIGCSPSKPVPKAATVVVEGTPVRVGEARQERIERAVVLTASLKSSAEIELAPRVSARVTGVLVREGDSVKAGAELLRQDTLDLITRKETAEAGVRQARASLASAQSALASAKVRLAQSKTQLELQQRGSAAAEMDAEQQLKASEAQLELARTPQRSQEVAVAESAVAQAEANFEKATLDRKRSAQLFEEGAASRSQVDQASTQERVAKAALETARAQLELIRTGGRDESIRQAESARKRAEVGLQLAKANRRQDDVRRDEVLSAEAAVAQAQSGVEQARANWESARATLRQVLQDIRYTVVVSPADAVVAKRSVEVGQLVGPGNVVLTLVSGERLYAEAVVPEVDVPDLAEGFAVDVRVDALPSRKFSGRIARIYPSSDSNRSYGIRIEFDSPNGVLRPGMFARASVSLPVRSGVVVEKDALVKAEDGSDVVFVVRNGKALLRKVQVGTVDDRVAEIAAGVVAGESVVTAGQTSLADGSPVIVSEPAGGKK